MSKSNRVKGIWSDTLGCRTGGSIQRTHRIQKRSERVTGFTQSPQTRVIKPTKQQRKLDKQPKGTDMHHPLSRKATLNERGAAFIYGLVNSNIHNREALT